MRLQLSDPRVVTTIDLLKSLGVVALLADHWGLYFDPDPRGWPLVGRVAAPIFFFLIGFSRSRRVPWTWLAFGAALTASDYVVTGQEEVTLNILLSFALLRALVLPGLERAFASPALLLPVVAALVVLTPASSDFLEYGTEGWLWSLLGVAQRLHGTEGRRPLVGGWRRLLVAAAALATYLVQETADYDFSIAYAVALAALIGALTVGFLRFRRSEAALPLPRATAAPLRFCGRYSLEIYAVTLLAMQALSFALGTGEGASDDDEDEDEEA
jgi:hypothetical protein